MPLHKLLILSTPLMATALEWGKQRRASACECLDFASVYESGKAYCGSGLEHVRVAVRPELAFPAAAAYSKMCLSPVSKAKDLATLWRAVNQPGICSWRNSLAKMDVEDCHDFPGIQNSSFYQHQRHSYCIKASQYAEHSSFMHSASWCYVSAECSNLNGGVRINSQVSWKTCVEGQDKFMGELSVPDLCALQDTLAPQGKYLGGCQMAAFKAFDMGSGQWQTALAADPTLLETSRRPIYWKDEKKDAAVVQQHGKRWEIYGDCRDGSDYKCVSGC